MGLLTHAVAFGLGYLLGRPGGKEQVMQLRHQVTELAEKPEVKRLAERGRGMAVERAQAARNAVSARVGSGKADSGPRDSAGEPVPPSPTPTAKPPTPTPPPAPPPPTQPPTPTTR
jgi:hypothetical protein